MMELVKVSGLRQENILINADFQSGIINQKGETTYISPGYAIDMWYLSGSSSKMTVLASSIKIEKTKENPYILMRQYIPYGINGIKDINFLLTIEIRASKKGKFELYNTKRYYDVVTSWKTLIIPFKGSDIDLENGSNDKVAVWVGVKDYDNPGIGNFNIGDWIEIRRIKLEFGNRYTGMPCWNKAIELLKCKNYFEVVNDDISSYQHNTSNAYFRLKYQNKRKIPEITFVDTGNINKSDGTPLAVTSFTKNYIRLDGATIKANFAAQSSTIPYYRINRKFFIDAYDY